MAAVLLLCGLPGPLLASDRSFCLEGTGIRAIDACRRALGKDRDTLGIYRALGSHLEASGNLKGAIGIYRRGLEAHPHDSQLAARLKITQSNLKEQTWIEKRRQVQQEQVPHRSNALFKVNRVRCTTLTGQEALTACEDALSVAPNDPVLQRRIAELRPPSQAVPPGRQPPQPRVRAAEPRAVPDPEVERQRALVARIQNHLAQLGYRPGPADGMAGAKTRAAATAYAEARGLEPSGVLFDAVLADNLDQALGLQKHAKALLDESQVLLREGRPEKARTRLDEAATAAAWSPLIARRHERLEARLAEMETALRDRHIDELSEKADAAIRAEDLAGAQTIIDEGLARYPDAPSLHARRKELAAAEIAQARRRAAQERQRVGDEKRLEAQASLERGHLEQASKIVADGLQLAPGHGGLLALRSHIEESREQHRLAQEKAEAERAEAAAMAERQRLQSLAAKQAAEASERAAAEARRERLQELLGEAEAATDRSDLETARQQLASAGELSPGDPRIADLTRRIKTRELTLGAEQKLRQANDGANAPNGFERRIALLEQATSMATDALALDPDDRRLWELRSEIAKQRTALLDEAQRQRQQREELAQLQRSTREQLLQLSKIETETAARETALKLDAQRLLETMWTQ